MGFWAPARSQPCGLRVREANQRSKSSDWSAAANHLAAVNDARRVQLHGGEPLLDSGEWLAESLLAEIR